MLKAINENSRYENKYEVIIYGISEIPYGYITVKAISPEHAIILVLKHFGFSGVLLDDCRRKKYAAHLTTRNPECTLLSKAYSITKVKRL